MELLSKKDEDDDVEDMDASLDIDDSPAEEPHQVSMCYIFLLRVWYEISEVCACMCVRARVCVHVHMSMWYMVM